VGRTKLFGASTLLKRVSQLAYLGSHPISHHRCASAIRRSRLASDPLIPMKYLGDHLALSLRTWQRRLALMGHYNRLPALLPPNGDADPRTGILIWQKDGQGDYPPLSIVLETSRLAPMEGELQLRFSFRSDLYVLTFLLSPGDIFDMDCPTVLFIGGIQGRIGSREEMREASKLNGEISPAAMLILAVQAIAKVMRVDKLIAIGEDDHISMGYSRSKIKLDYGQFWIDAGGVRRGRHYVLPLETPQRPLSEISLSHRSRTRRKREAKQLVRQAIEARLQQLIRAEHAKPRVATASAPWEPAFT
jgi:uncharacterized protein VirK/YbjX